MLSSRNIVDSARYGQVHWQSWIAAVVVSQLNGCQDELFCGIVFAVQLLEIVDCRIGLSAKVKGLGGQIRRRDKPKHKQSEKRQSR